MNPLTTAIGTGPNQYLHIHINDSSLPIIARNILILKVISKQNFAPENIVDIGYVWDLWYHATWSESTKKRFVKDIKDLLNKPLPPNIIIPDSSFQEQLKNVWAEWLTMVTTFSVDDTLANR